MRPPDTARGRRRERAPEHGSPTQNRVAVPSVLGLRQLAVKYWDAGKAQSLIQQPYEQVKGRLNRFWGRGRNAQRGA